MRPHCVSVQGDRGFDGLPGLPGEKGHRVSPQRFSLTKSFDAENIFFRIPLMLNPCENHAFIAMNMQILKEAS